MRDLILFSEIYNLIFLVYNAFIRHKQLHIKSCIQHYKEENMFDILLRNF